LLRPGGGFVEAGRGLTRTSMGQDEATDRVRVEGS